MSDGDQRPSRTSRTSQRFKDRLPFLSRNSRMGSEQGSTFSPSDILPQDGHKPYPKRPQSDAGYEEEGQSNGKYDEQVDSKVNSNFEKDGEKNSQKNGENNGQPVFGAPSGAPMQGNARSASPPSVFSKPDGSQDRETEPTPQSSDDPNAYDLKPPAPNLSNDNIEQLADRFFSADHLDTILHDPNAGPRFTRFLNQYKPQHATTLTHYIESRKAITAVEYANAIASQIPIAEGESRFTAASLDDAFLSKSQKIVEDLIEEALPAFLTHRMVSLVTDSLVKAITGEGVPLMKELIPNLAEVFCISDPSVQDNPIVYASEEFYNVTQYGRDYSIGRNCRFLQGPRTMESSVKRLIEALAAGEEICEMLVNYRRDGEPFMNLLMIAPLYDNKGEVRYFLGCQIDVSPLIENGRGLDSFSQLLQQDKSNGQRGNETEPVNLLGELGQMLSEPEADFVQGRMQRSSSQASGKSSTKGSGKSTPSNRRPQARRYLSMDDQGAAPQSTSRAMWPDASLGHSGRLPGVYRNYLLVRPYPSLRVTFTSPTLRIPGLLQAKLLDRIGGPQHLRDGVLEALENGTSITAKVPWLTNPIDDESRGGETAKGDGKPRWIHCTPLFGSDDKVGVWMVILVENEEVTGLLNKQEAANNKQGQKSTSSSGFASPQPLQLGAIGRQDTGKEMYADYLKTDRPQSKHSKETTASARERREVDDNFRDF